MTKSMDKKTLALLLLTACAVLLTYVRERPVWTPDIAVNDRSREVLPLTAINAIVDSTVARMGADPAKCRRLNISAGEVKGVRQELRVQAPPSFGVLRAITTLTDSLRKFGVTLASTENLKEKTSSIHLLYSKRVFESIVISREKHQKGLLPSARKKAKEAPRKARR